MIASQLINEQLSPLRISDSVDAALSFMINQGVTELPLIDQKQLWNYVRLQQLATLGKNQKLGEAIPKHPFPPSARSNQHLYELIPLLAANELSIIAVTDLDQNIVGMIEQKTMNKVIAESFTYRGMGAILVIKMSDRDYAPSQIARWIEENGAKILGLVTNHADEGMLTINIKLNTTSVKNILATFSRQDIDVEHVFMADDYDENDTKAFDMVFKFLDL